MKTCRLHVFPPRLRQPYRHVFLFFFRPSSRGVAPCFILCGPAVRILSPSLAAANHPFPSLTILLTQIPARLRRASKKNPFQSVPVRSIRVSISAPSAPPRDLPAAAPFPRKISPGKILRKNLCGLCFFASLNADGNRFVRRKKLTQSRREAQRNFPKTLPQKNLLRGLRALCERLPSRRSRRRSRRSRRSRGHGRIILNDAP